jgi:hypothetical protein
MKDGVEVRRCLEAIKPNEVIGAISKTLSERAGHNADI